MYITNNPTIAIIAQKYGVDRIWIDLETLGKGERQKNINSVKSNHSIADIKKIAPVLDKSELLVRINPINNHSKKEIDAVVDAGADIIMLPMWNEIGEVRKFLEYVDGRVKTTLLLETKEAVECVDDVLAMGGFDEIHIGLNDLHLSYGLVFMFELLTNGVVEMLCDKFRRYKIQFGFGGIARLGEGMVPAEKIIMEHYRLGSTRVILSRSFCNTDLIKDLNEIEAVFKDSLYAVRRFEDQVAIKEEKDFIANKIEIADNIQNVIQYINKKRKI